MHLRELDVGRMIRAFVLTCVCLLMIVPTITVQAQQQPSTPSPGDFAGQVAGAVERVGGTTNAIQLGIVILLIIGAWVGLKPLISTIESANRRADTSFQEAQAANQRAKDAHDLLLDRIKREDEQERQRDVLRVQQAQTLDRAVNHLDEIDTHADAKQRQDEIQANSNAARDAINTHVDEAVKPILEATETIIEAADNTLTTLQEVEKRLGQLATKAELVEQLQPLRESVERLREAIEHQLLPSLPTTPNDSTP